MILFLLKSIKITISTFFTKIDLISVTSLIILRWILQNSFTFVDLLNKIHGLKIATHNNVDLLDEILNKQSCFIN